MSTVSIPPDASFFGFSSTKRYFPVETFYGYFSSAYARRMLGDLVFFVSEAEAIANEYIPADASSIVPRYKDMTGENLVAIIAARLGDMKEAVEELVQAQEQPLAWFRRRLVGDVSEKEAAATIEIGLMDLTLTIRGVVEMLEQDRAESQKVLKESQQTIGQLQKTLAECQGLRHLREVNLQSERTSNQNLNKQVHDLQGELEREQEQSNKKAWEVQKLQEELQTARATSQELNGQLTTLRQQSARDTQDLMMQKDAVQKQVEKLEVEKALFIPPEYDNLLSSIRGYLTLLYAAKDIVMVKKIPLRRNHIDTLFFSNNPSEVAHALTQHSAFNEMVRQGGRRVLEKDMLLGFAGVLGYYNFYVYLLQVPSEHEDCRFLQMLCDLSIPSWQVEAAASNIEAASWLANHLPPQSNVPGTPCYFTFLDRYVNNYDKKLERETNALEDREIAQAIIGLEKQSLLDFRKSLFVAVSAIAPLTPEEEELQEQSHPAQPTASAALTPSFRMISDKHERDLHNGLHVIAYEYTDPLNLSAPMKLMLAYNNNGEVLTEESEQDE